MSLHVFGNTVTAYGTAANNRGETPGHITTLQKLIWKDQVHTSVSAEAVRFALRRQLAELDANGTNRKWVEHDSEIPKEFAEQFKKSPTAPCNVWTDLKFGWYDDPKAPGYIDDDLLGFMSAEASQQEGEAGTANVRRAVLELTRAISLTPWAGDVTFNAASPLATPSAAKKGEGNPVPYGTEVHATRYQFGFAMTPGRLRDPSRAAKAVQAIGSLRSVAGNHGRFLFDFSPDSIVLRVTDDPAPRLLYCFETINGGATVEAPSLVDRVKAGDISPGELIGGGPIVLQDTGQQLREAGVESLFEGVKEALRVACERIDSQV